MKPVLTQRDSLLLSAPGAPRLALPQSRVGDAPNNLLHDAFAPCILQPGIVHKSRYPQCTAVLRKNLRQTECARVSVQWRQVSCVPTQKRLVEGLRLCEAELPCFGFNSHGGIASAPSLSSSGNCCRMDCSS